MCSAVCQQSHSRLPARTDQSRSVRGSRPLMMHEIAASRSPAVTVMMLRAYGHGQPGMTEFVSNDADSDLLARTVRSAAVLVVTANPELGVALGRFGAAPGDEIEELVGAVDRVDATGIRRVGVEHLPWPVLDKSTKSFPVLESRGAGAEVVDPERAVRAARVPLRREHEVVDDELATAVEQVGQRGLPVWPFEDVLLR